MFFTLEFRTASRYLGPTEIFFFPPALQFRCMSRLFSLSAAFPVFLTMFSTVSQTAANRGRLGHPQLESSQELHILRAFSWGIFGTPPTACFTALANSQFALAL